jgi:UV DNA damage repair endonuclease
MFEAFKSSGFSFIIKPPVETIGEYKKLPEKWFENFAFKKATFEKPNGMEIISERALSNIQTLKKVVQWNYDNGINFYRMSSGMFPWWTKYEFKQLKDWPQIKEILEDISKLEKKWRLV